MRLRRKLLLFCLLLIVGFITSAAWHYFEHNDLVADFTAVDFHNEYKDWKTANQRYVGRSMAINGEVLSVEYSWLTPHGWKSVGLGKGGKGVICHFSTDKVYQAESLVPGQVVVIRGVCRGEFAGCPILSDCEVESTDWLWWLSGWALCVSD